MSQSKTALQRSYAGFGGGLLVLGLAFSATGERTGLPVALIGCALVAQGASPLWNRYEKRGLTLVVRSLIILGYAAGVGVAIGMYAFGWW